MNLLMRSQCVLHARHDLRRCMNILSELVRPQGVMRVRMSNLVSCEHMPHPHQAGVSGFLRIGPDASAA